jgi:hypothetical protein
MALLRLAALAALLAGCTFNPEVEVGQIVCAVGDDNTCPSGFTCTLTEASPEGLCCKGSHGACTEEPPGLAARIGGMGGQMTEPDAAPVPDGRTPDRDAMGAPGGTGGSSGMTADGAAAGSGGGGLAPDGGAGGSAGAPADAAAGTGGTSSPGDASSDRASDAVLDAAPDVPSTPSCTPACTLGDRRCSGSGLQSCVVIAGCPGWGATSACGTAHKACTGAEPNARCACPAAPAACNDVAGAFCSSASTLETCVSDSDGCIAMGASSLCPAGKPCTGTAPAASCSCGAAPAACQGASGNICTSGSTMITCGSNAAGCPAVLAMKSCGPSETCQGSAGSAGCTCDAPPAACAGTGSGTVCASGSVVACGTTAAGCVTASTVKSCPGGKPCAVSGGVADCRCGAVAPECAGGVTGTVCSGNTVITCGMNADGCPTSSTLKTCTAGKPCGGAAGAADCTCASAPECGATSSGNVCQSPTGYATCGSNSDGCVVKTGNGTCPADKPCAGAAGAGTCTCTGEPTSSDCPAGMDAGSRCVGTTLYACGASASGCKTLVKTVCPANGACVDSYPAARCVTEVTFGNATDGLGADSPHNTGFLLGSPFQVTTKVTLKRFGLITRDAPGKVSLALYSDNGVAGAGAAPANYIAGALLVPIVAGKHEYAVNNPPAANITLTPGTYWMLASFEKSTMVAHGPDAQMQFFRAATQTPWDKAMPMPYPSNAPSYYDTPANYYLVGLPQ